MLNYEVLYEISKGKIDMYQDKIVLRSEFTSLSWKVAAFFIGGSLPLILFGKAVLATWFSLGLIFGCLAMIEDRPNWQDIKGVFMSNVAKATLIMLLIFSASALNSVDQHYSLVRFYEMFYLSVASGLLVLIFNKMPKVYVYLTLKVLCVATLMIGAFVLIDSFVDSDRLSYTLHGRKWEDIDRLEQIGSIIAILAPFVWTWTFKLSRKDFYWARKLGLAASYALFFVAIVCGGVAGWFAVFTAAFVFLVMGGRWHALSLRTKHWLLLPCAIFTAFLGYFTASGVEHLQSNQFLNKYSEYTQFIEDSIDVISTTPVLGVGVNATRFLPTPDAAIGKSTSQNFLLQLLLETGFLGLAASVVLILMVLYRLYRYARVNIYGLAGISSMVAFFVASLANTSIFNAWWLAFFIALSSLSIRLCKKTR
tara:strand:- start:1227 stop:2495 length:1269 start_codon:yes stop_codon:yes gene_type:complete